jgi:hypothetical protein
MRTWNKSVWISFAVFLELALIVMVAYFLWPGPQIRALTESDPVPGPQGPQGSVGPAGPAGANADPAVLLQDPAFKALVDNAVATQVVQAPTPENQSAVTNPPVQVVGVTSAEPITIGDWKISYFDGVTTQMKSWTFKNLDPALWPVFPNVDNAGYPAANGVEYGMAESVFCQQDQRCDFEVAARHYRLFTGDYKIDGIGECYTKDGIGCALAVFNVGDVTAFWASQEMHDGFTVTGRYWNGEVLPHAIWALLSNAVSNMLNLNSPLNQNGGANAGANCSVPGGCIGVDTIFAITSGNQVLVTGHTITNK